MHHWSDVSLRFILGNGRREVPLNLVVLAIGLGLVILVCLGVIGAMLCIIKMQRDELNPMLPPVKLWDDADYEQLWRK